MFRTIRLRLVMGAVLLTLLTVSAVGVVALLLMQRYMVQQERAYLMANAQSIAQQAGGFMSPGQVSPPLQQLAQTAAFLGDVTVRIVDSTQVPLADSTLTMPATAAIGMETSPIYFRVAAPLAGVETAVQVPEPQMVWTTTTHKFMLETTEGTSATSATLATVPSTVPSVMAKEANVIVVQKSPSIWGDRLVFEAQEMPVSQPIPVDQEVVVPYAVEQAVPNAMGQTQAIPAAAAYGVAATVANPSMAAPAMAGVTVVEPTLPDSMYADVVMGEPAQMYANEWAYGATGQAGEGRETVLVDRVDVAKPSFLQAAGLQSTDSVTVPIQAGGQVVGFVELARAMDLVDEPLGAIRQALAIAAGASALLAIAVGLVMSHTLTAPIQNLAQTAAAMSSGDLTARAPVVGQDELASLARQFNQMADALHRSFAELAAERDTLRRFVADASHELRTPITALRTFNELLQGPARTDRRAQTEFLAESHAQIARLEWITRNLLDLSRWDGGMATLVMAEVEVGELVATAAAPFRALAQERQIDLNVVASQSPIMARVDEQRLGMAVGNLLDNALKFTPDAGQVVVGVRQDVQGVKIWVQDTGMGICSEDLPHIFARFYRSPRATQAGSGLGLAIVERIVNAHGATIGVESEVGVGSKFTLCLG